jgi:hypothetical protein
MKNPMVMGRIQKLVNAGIVQVRWCKNVNYRPRPPHKFSPGYSLLGFQS